MTNLSTEAIHLPQPTELSSKIVSVYELLMDSALDVPQYQRPYKWTGKNINQLFSDIAIHKDKSAYRLGTIVFHQEGGTRNIVDGQQRTVSLLLAARALIQRNKEKSSNATTCKSACLNLSKRW
jgi:uncharacterized protein with ParB-like and HNH nuclease domain